jgi:hypothetical protein
MSNLPQTCPYCSGEFVEIDHYGDRLIGCAKCNKWNWRGGKGSLRLSYLKMISKHCEPSSNGRQSHRSSDGSSLSDQNGPAFLRQTRNGFVDQRRK